MALLSKEEEIKRANIIILKKIAIFLTFKEQIISIDKRYSDRISEMEFLINNGFDQEIIERIFMEMLISMELDRRFDDILNKLKLNRNYLIQMAIRCICTTDPRLKKYDSVLKEILNETHIEQYEEKDGNLTISNSNCEFQINRIFQYSNRNKIKAYMEFSSVFIGEQMKNCHGFNTMFYDSFPGGSVVTGNISSRFKDIRFSHTWIEDKEMVYVPNLNYSTSKENYYILFDPTDLVVIPYSRIEKDRNIRRTRKQPVDLYEYLRNPDEIMARLK